MVDFLSRLSSANVTQQTDLTSDNGHKMQKMTAGMEERLSKMYGGKKITDHDVEKAMNEPSGRNVINALVKRSPIGFEEPTIDDLMHNGYAVAYHRNLDGSYDFVGNNGNINVLDAQDGSVKMNYKSGKFEQNMVYDKNGQVKAGTLIFRDDFGAIERQIDFQMQKDGKMFVIQ